MLLVIDVGNTTTVAGLYEKEKLLYHWRLVSERKTSDEVGILILNLLSLSKVEPGEIQGAIMASVVPPVDRIVQEAVRNYLSVQCLKLTSDMDFGLSIAYKDKNEVGADRLANSVAGVAKYGSPLIVVDFGTAITLDVISKDGAYLGGTISPGLVTGMDALFGKTSKLPQVSLEAPETVVGGSTKGAIQSGIVYGAAGAVDGLVRRIWRELGCVGSVVATGGHGDTIAKVSETIGYVDPWLTLEGLRLVYSRVKGDL